MESAAMTADQRKFHLMEYSKLKAEIRMALKGVYQILVATVLAEGAILAWIVTNRQQLGAAYSWVWTIPIGVWVIGMTGSWHLGNVMRAYGSYIRKIEAALGAPDLGWERSSEMARQGRGARVVVTRVVIVVGVGLIVAGLFFQQMLGSAPSP